MKISDVIKEIKVLFEQEVKLQPFTPKLIKKCISNRVRANSVKIKPYELTDFIDGYMAQALWNFLKNPVLRSPPTLEDAIKVFDLAISNAIKHETVCDDDDYTCNRAI